MSIIEEFEVVAFKYIAFGRGQWERDLEITGPCFQYTALEDDAEIEFLPVGQSGERAADSPDRRLSRRYPEGSTILIESNTAHLPGATSL